MFNQGYPIRKHPTGHGRVMNRAKDEHFRCDGVAARGSAVEVEGVNSPGGDEHKNYGGDAIEVSVELHSLRREG